MTQPTKINLAILCGGQSAEHEVSFLSAKNILAALDTNKYHIYVIYITKSGQWLLLDSVNSFLRAEKPEQLVNCPGNVQLTVAPGVGEPVLATLNSPLQRFPVDVFFPVLHGTCGEDGTVQGLAKLLNAAIVGADVLSSAICMDKEVCKKLLLAANIPVAKWLSATQADIAQFTFAQVVEQLGLPFFVKPSNAGSSVGITKVKNAEQFHAAINLALKYNYRIIFEKYIPGREIECAVLGNEAPQASLPAEIITHSEKHEFYSYEAKYLDPEGALLKVPAELPHEIIADIQAMAKAAFKACYCEGMARVDFFLTAEGQLLVNELNTIPGFTQISMYPKMWQVSGLAYSDLLDKLINLALQRWQREQNLCIN